MGTVFCWLVLRRELPPLWAAFARSTESRCWLGSTIFHFLFVKINYTLQGILLAWLIRLGNIWEMIDATPQYVFGKGPKRHSFRNLVKIGTILSLLYMYIYIYIYIFRFHYLYYYSAYLFGVCCVCVCFVFCFIFVFFVRTCWHCSMVCWITLLTHTYIYIYICIGCKQCGIYLYILFVSNIEILCCQFNLLILIFWFPNMPCMKRFYTGYVKASACWSAARNEERVSSHE